MTEQQRKTFWSILGCAAIIALFLPWSPFSKVGLKTALSRLLMSEQTNDSPAEAKAASGVKAA
jgi:hypothetical protein